MPGASLSEESLLLAKLRVKSVPQIPNNSIIWVCETQPVILYSDVAIFPRFGGIKT